MSEKQMTGEAGVRRRRGRITGSMTEQIDRMQIGESLSLCQRFEIGGPEGAGPEEIKQGLVLMRARLHTYASRVVSEDDLDVRRYRTESGTFLTDDKSAVVAVAMLTRVE